MKFNKKKTIISLIINTFLFISTFIVSVNGVAYGASAGQLGDSMKGIGYFKAYTMDSNILMGFLAFMMIAFNINSLVKKENDYPGWMVKTYLVGTTAVTLTFITVCVFLAPMFEITGMGWKMMFKNDLFFFHFLNPLLALFNFIFFIPSQNISRKTRLFGLIPTVIYSIVYMTAVLVLKSWDDFYNFTFGGKLFMVPISLIVMYAATYGISTLLSIFHNKKVSL